MNLLCSDIVKSFLASLRQCYLHTGRVQNAEIELALPCLIL